MSLASEPMGRLAIARHEQAKTTTTKPRMRTATAKADIVSDPEAR